MDMRSQIGPEGQGRPLIVALDQVDAGALPLVGGKAASLGELIAAGLPVPTGFCVTTEAYRDVAAAAGLAEILDRLAATPAGDIGALAGLARQARERILAMAMPALVADAVAAAYLDLGDGVPVAVRSSATAEDLPFASFAGQQDTYLNILGVAVDGPGRGLPGDQRHRPRHGAPRGGRPALGRGGRGWCHVHRQPGDRPAPAGGHRRDAGAW